jgi:diketogulonate reductase-like aldo/keto reductase
MTALSPVISLNNGVTLPALGLGVFQSPPAETAQAVDAALRTGYRIAENFGVFDFELTHEQGAAIDALDTGVRGGP